MVSCQNILFCEKAFCSFTNILEYLFQSGTPQWFHLLKTVYALKDQTFYLGGFKNQLTGYTIYPEIKMKSASFHSYFHQASFTEKLRSPAFRGGIGCKIRRCWPFYAIMRKRKMTACAGL